MAEADLTARIAPSIGSLPGPAWDGLAGPENPFMSHAFLTALEDSGSVGPGTGWTPAPLVIEDGAGHLLAALPAYAKGHSQGEYVFDHAWADAWERAGGQKNAHNPADPYMTVLGYFNSLRELGGSRRIIEDEVRTRLVEYGRRQRRDPHDELFRTRNIDYEVLELTSRVSTDKVAEAKRRLALSFHNDERVDVGVAPDDPDRVPVLVGGGGRDHVHRVFDARLPRQQVSERRLGRLGERLEIDTTPLLTVLELRESQKRLADSEAQDLFRRFHDCLAQTVEYVNGI